MPLSRGLLLITLLFTLIAHIPLFPAKKWTLPHLLQSWLTSFPGSLTCKSIPNPYCLEGLFFLHPCWNRRLFLDSSWAPLLQETFYAIEKYVSALLGRENVLKEQSSRWFLPEYFFSCQLWTLMLYPFKHTWFSPSVGELPGHWFPLYFVVSTRFASMSSEDLYFSLSIFSTQCASKFVSVWKINHTFLSFSQIKPVYK